MKQFFRILKRCQTESHFDFRESMKIWIKAIERKVSDCKGNADLWEGERMGGRSHTADTIS